MSASARLNTSMGLAMLLALGAGLTASAASASQPRFHVDVPVGGQIILHDWQRGLQTGDRFALQPARYRHCVEESGGNTWLFNLPLRCYEATTGALVTASGSLAPAFAVTSGDLWSVEVVQPAPPGSTAEVRLVAPSGRYLKLLSPDTVSIFSEFVETDQQSEATILRLRQGTLYGPHGPPEEASISYLPPGTNQEFRCRFLDMSAQAVSKPLTLVCGKKDWAFSDITGGTVKLHMAPQLLSINLAYLRPTAQSSSYGANPGHSGLAVDGNVDGNYGAGSVTHTAGQNQPWWQVDLGAPVSIGQLVIHNRTDCCSERLTNFEVSFSNDGSHFFGHIHHAGTAPPRLRLDTDQTARFVRVQLKGSGILSLAEVQVFPRLEDLALGRQAFQSSTEFGGDAQRGVDGRINSYWSGGSVTHTGNQIVNPFWRVELGDNRYIDHVIVYNRTDCCGDRLDKARVKIRTQEGQEVVVGQLNAGAVQRVPVGMHGVSVTVQSDRLDYHSVAEVVVLGW